MFGGINVGVVPNPEAVDRQNCWEYRPPSPEYINVVEWRRRCSIGSPKCRTILQPIAASVVEKKFLSNVVAAVSW
jgi:hypothetical protein